MNGYRFDLITKRISRVEQGGSAATAAHASLLSDTIYVAQGTTIKAIGAGSAATAVWRSRVNAYSWPEGYGWMRVNGPEIVNITVRYYVDGVLRHTHVFNSREPKRLPARNGHKIELEIEANVRVTSLSVAKSAEELSS